MAKLVVFGLRLKPNKLHKMMVKTDGNEEINMEL
jgi:hypothetical protein